MRTHFKTGLTIKANERGAAIITVILLCSLLLILLGIYLSALSNQSRIHYRASIQNEARNAAEGVAEYALAEMNRRADSLPSFGVGANPNPLSGYSLTSADLAFLAPGTGNNHVVSSSIGYKNSPLSNSPTSPILIDPSDPINVQDNDKGKIMSVRSLNIFSKAATLDPKTQQQVTQYVSEHVQIRELTWFNYAIFYNMDLEFHAGPNFTVLGPVHTNATAYVTEGDGKYLQFFSTLTAYNKILRYDKYTGDTSGGHGGTVQCISAPGMLSSALKTMATTEDSRNTNFYTVAKTKWNSFVQDQTFSVTKFNPPGLPAYVPEDFSTAATELRNNAYLMIEPQLSSLTTDLEYPSDLNHPIAGQNDYGQKALASENLKFSALSSFVIQVYRPLTIGAQPQWKLIVYQATDTTHPLSSNNPPARDSTTGKPIHALEIDPFNDKDDLVYPAPSTLAVIKRSLKSALLDAIIVVPYQDAGSVALVSWGNGFSALKKFNQSAPGATNTIDYYPLYDRREGYIYPNSSSSTTNGLQGAKHTVIINLGKLNALLNDSSGKWLKPYGSTDYVYNPSTTYTGVVYVQMPLEARTDSRFPTPVGTTGDGDQIRPAQLATTTSPGYALLLSNAGTVPQLSGGSPDGFTVATNGPVYVWGNFNADGSSSTGSSTTPDNANEVPSMIAGDSVTILSANNSYNFANMATGMNSAASFTEISAAIVTGLVPTHPGYNNVWSGGVHNLVRFLEDWGSSTYRYRGSIAVLFESEVNKGAYHEGYNGFFYGAPTRDMGYHQYLSQGRFPPATPIKRTVRRINLQDISPAAYTTGPSTPPAVN